ncbi:MAG: aminopeptidase, partial [Bacteroidales bacterium]|nr:aminopeptidase [Bacteroidales bacterium]
MRQTILALLALSLPLLPLSAQEEQKKEEGFQFTTVKENPITTVKNQNRSSTCWSFSSIGFFESELLRLGKGEYDLSEMFVVHKTMEDRAERSVRLHGDVSFS